MSREKTRRRSVVTWYLETSTWKVELRKVEHVNVERWNVERWINDGEKSASFTSNLKTIILRSGAKLWTEVKRVEIVVAMAGYLYGR